ncbi:MAG: MFS transporter, partial [Sphingomonadaceae bacterium]|nr:MFS transporter [Sphingomonadaceae bacterium]
SLISGLFGLALILNLVPILTFTGISRGDAVIIAGIMGLASLAGRLIGGWLMDRFDVRHLAILAAVLSALFPLTLIVAPGVVWATMLALIFHALTGGLRMSAIVYLTSTYMGARSFGLLYGAINTTTTVAMGVGPLIANHIYDLTASYNAVLWAALPASLLTALLLAALGPAPDFSRPSPAG